MDYSVFCDTTELLALARLDLQKDRLDHALLKLKQALAASKSAPAPELLAELGRLYARLNLRDRAKEMFDRYLQAVPDAVQERFQLGMVYFEEGDRAHATALWEEVLHQVPNHPPALFHMATSRAQSGELEQAWTLCKTVLDKVEGTNLYFGRSKELLQRIEADPAFKHLKGSSAPSARAKPRVQH